MPESAITHTCLIAGSLIGVPGDVFSLSPLEVLEELSDGLVEDSLELSGELLATLEAGADLALPLVALVVAGVGVDSLVIGGGVAAALVEVAVCELLPALATSAASARCASVALSAGELAGPGPSATPARM
ncbi:MAG: hypothetical protein WBV77_05150, partial [Solirubrobacteraceae bacterium]